MLRPLQQAVGGGQLSRQKNGVWGTGGVLSCYSLGQGRKAPPRPLAGTTTVNARRMTETTRPIVLTRGMFTHTLRRHEQWHYLSTRSMTRTPRHPGTWLDSHRVPRIPSPAPNYRQTWFLDNHKKESFDGPKGCGNYTRCCSDKGAALANGRGGRTQHSLFGWLVPPTSVGGCSQKQRNTLRSTASAA